MIEKLIGWFTENHVAANLLMIFLLLAGVLTLQNIKIETFPEFAPDMISISMEYPGASPEEVEEAIIRRIEERIAGLAGIKKITASARESFGSVTIEVLSNWDLDQLTNEVKSEVDRIRTFPNEAEKPIVRQIVRKNQVINIALYGDAPEPTIKHLAEKIKADLVEPARHHAGRDIRRPQGGDTSRHIGEQPQEIRAHAGPRGFDRPAVEPRPPRGFGQIEGRHGPHPHEGAQVLCERLR